jgi:hypothetical protein
MLLEQRRNERGQVAILFALIFTFMFILFAFVVDFGQMVNNKINLQNAADAASYAGAAYQARILNQIGQVNYHIRQDLKELAMRLHVTHTRHNRNFPRGSDVINGGDNLPRGYYPFVCQQASGYQAISGLRYAADTNLCRNASPDFGGLPPIVVPPVIAAFDPFAVAIAAQIRKIQEKANQECKAAANDNRRLVEHLIAVYTRRLNFHRNQLKQLEQFLNEVSNENPNSSNHPVVQAALESARRNLTLSNRDGFRMEIMQPQGNEYVRLDETKLRASIFFYDFNVVGDGCVGKPSFVDVEDFSMGFTKNRAIVTYFAVKLESQPQMMYMPARWLESAFPLLQAFSAAKPFGSRIGPESNTDQLLPVPNRPGNNNRMVNFSFRPNDRFGIMNTKVMAYLDALHPSNNVPRPDGNRNSGWPEPGKERGNLALQAIRAPTIFDAIFYTIHPTPGGNIQNDYAEPEYAEALFPDYLEASNPDNTLVQNQQPRTPAYLPAGVGSRNRGQGWIQVNANESGFGGPYGGYAEEGPASHSVVGASSLPEIGGRETEFGWASKDLINSGWAPDGRPGRIGYSVKFIPFDALNRTLIIQLDATGRSGPIANPPRGDENVTRVIH